MSGDTEAFGAMIDYDGLGKEEWTFRRDLRRRDPYDLTVSSDDAMKVWRTLRQKYLQLAALEAQLLNPRYRRLAGVAEIDRLVEQSTIERKACAARISAIESGGPAVWLGYSEDTKWLGASDDADQAEGDILEVVVAAIKGVIATYPASATEAR